MSLPRAGTPSRLRKSLMYQRRTLKILNMFAALTAMAMLAAAPHSSAASASPTSAASSGASLVFSYPNGFAGASGAIRAAWEAALSGSAINLTPLASAHQAGGAWYTAQQNISSFTTDFTFQLTPGSMPSIQG